MTVYDISVPVTDGTDWYGEPGCDPVSLRQVGSIPREGWVSNAMGLMVLNGTTYLETAAHIFEDAPTLDEIAPERFVTRAFIISLEVGARELPAPDSRIDGFEPGRDAILLACRWDVHIEQPDYYHASPYFSPELQEWLLDHRPAILGGDMLSFDHPADATMPFIHAYFRQGGMILCPLVGLTRVPHEAVTLCAAPLRLTGASAAPCRALVW